MSAGGGFTNATTHKGGKNRLLYMREVAQELKYSETDGWFAFVGVDGWGKRMQSAVVVSFLCFLQCSAG